MIGIGITEHNRYHIFLKTYGYIKKFMPKDAVLVVVDDASTSPFPESTFRFNNNVGIAVAKNKCLELLYNAGCEHIFLFDSDTFPVVDNWWIPYINSKENHLNYIFTNFKNGININDSEIVYKNENIIAYTHPRGCMLYYKRIVLDTVGGMDKNFGKWGYEHVSLSERIYNAGLTSYKYMDIANSKGLFFSDDEHNSNRNSSVRPTERNRSILKNKMYYESKQNSKEFINFMPLENIIMTCFFTSQKDTQRNINWTADLSELQPLIISCAVHGYKLIVLNDCFDNINIPNVEFIRTECKINPYFQRWMSYYEYLKDQKNKIGGVFMVDATDVEIINKIKFDNTDNVLFCGDEPSTINNVWLKKHHTADFLKDFYKDYSYKTLLNAGIVGGSIGVVLEFLEMFISEYELNNNNQLTDMALFNFIAYKMPRIEHGIKVNTIYKKFEYNNISWFKHK